MRTNIDIDDALMVEAMAAAALPTKKATVEEALRLLIRRKKQRDLLALRGMLPWDGDLDDSRSERRTG
ncbi:type II toxin-antitoxin system VapB family antitoxin [Oceanibaculum sp.]|uniref:type II toxin-antitoxin system VapB family antitoxin n=1 Tax=Oceanibaculum sp. TaxID=1903597 RepID=UPI00258947F7|nr:type II toxin-antitoxin system VapB family antitoxin [Oceanibaculum sp.]MCH2394091.1 type II toxin-antitoxin system VapB family antitoxin [Oceanibaculum sp.]